MKSRRPLLRLIVLPVLIVGLRANSSAAQSTTASISGTVYDQQYLALPGVRISLTNTDTGLLQERVSTAAGLYQFIGLAPGHYQLLASLPGFATVTRAIDLHVIEQARLDPILPVAFSTTTDVTASSARLDSSKGVLGLTITTKQIDELPLAGRNFVNLALLAPGILTNQVATGSSTGIATAAQTGKNNSFVIDGLTLDDTSNGAARGTLPLDAIREFVVLSNNFQAEFGQASGAIVTMVTRSGTNQFAGRASYYHRDDRWDAPSFAGRLASPPLPDSKFEQKVLGGFFGGPIVQNRAFFFTSVEYTRLDTEAIVTSPVLHDLRPDAPTHIPVEQRVPIVVGRADLALSPSNLVTLRYRVQRSTMKNSFGANDVGSAAPERAFDVRVRQEDVALIYGAARGPRAFNELRTQLARGGFDRDDPNCQGCWQEDHLSIKLGKLNQVPSGQTEDRWQIADTFTYLPSRLMGEHSLKAGVDLSLVALNARGLQDADGTYTFNTEDLTRPNRYTQSFGPSTLDLQHTLAAVFLQDQWKPRPNVTLDLGLRWDYDSGPGISGDKGDVAPRASAVWMPSRSGHTWLRGGYGRYYDQVPLSVARTALQTEYSIVIQNPIYDTSLRNGYDLNRSKIGKPSDVLLSDLRTPYTDQISIGIQRAIGTQTTFTADVVHARGRQLLVTHDLNYPDLNDPARPRPDPEFQKQTTVQARGNSWYRGLQLGLEKRHSHGYSFAVAYTLSSSERDTEDSTFIPQDQNDFAAERGPAANDVRHRLSAAFNLDVPWHIRFTAIVTAQSALPYTITLPNDANRDGNPNDRPDGVGRNSARGGDMRSLDVRLSKSFRPWHEQIEALVEAFNVTNRANWTAFDGKQGSATFQRATAALPARQIQLGIRVGF